MTDRTGLQPRAPDPGPGTAPSDRERRLADATARVRDQSGRLAGENPRHATREDVARWIAVYSELLAFTGELLEVTGRWSALMSEEARGEAADDHVVLGAQANKYVRRLHEWKSHKLAAAGAASGGATSLATSTSVSVRQEEGEVSPIPQLRALSLCVAQLGRAVAGALAVAEVDAIGARFASDEAARTRVEGLE